MLDTRHKVGIMQPIPTHPKPHKTMENTNENTTPNLWEIEAQKRHDKCVAETYALRDDAQVRVANLRLAVNMLNRMLEQAETVALFADNGVRMAKDREYENADNNVLVLRSHMDAQRVAVRQVGLGLTEIL